MGIKKVAIIGAGISGLALAHYLHLRFKNTLQLAIYEKNAVVGGNIASIHDSGFLFESGPNGFMSNQPATLDLVKDLDLSSSLLSASQTVSRRYIQINGKLSLVPMDPISFIQTDLLSTSEKMQLVSGIFKNKISKEQSIHDYVTARFGQAVAEKLADPFISGIYAGDTRRLRMDAAFPKLGQKRKGKVRLYSFTNGMEQIIDKLALRYNTFIRTRREVASLRSLDADHTIITLPAYAAAAIVKESSIVLHDVLSEIPYTPVAVIGLGFNASAFKAMPQGFGYLIPSSQKKEILGVLIESNVYPNRAPEGKVMVRVMMGGAHHPSIINYSVEALVEKALSELDGTYGLKEKPLKTWSKVWPKAIAQFEMKYPDWRARISAESFALRNVTLAGNYISGVSFNDCIAHARYLAENIKM